MDIEKIKSENITHEEHMNNVLQDIISKNVFRCSYTRIYHRR